MKKSILLSLLLMIGVMAYADATGQKCREAIPLGKNYTEEVKAGQTIWYSAWTFDLPLSVYFAPTKGEGQPAPEVEMDFSCVSGYYTDPILCSLFCKTSGGSGIDMGLPHKPTLNSTKLDDGTFVYYLSLGKRYRDLLLQVGISYNVEVYVKVHYLCDGTITLTPDDLFTNCMDGAKFMHIGDPLNDTVQVAANDTNRHVIFPFLQWQEDTIIYKWTGNAPCEVVVANTCDFLVYNLTDENIIDRKTIAPGDSVKIKATAIYDWVHNPDYPNEAGMYFAKIKSEEPGVLKIKKAAQAAPDGGATLLRFDRTYALDANSQAIYAIPRSWDVNVKLTAPTSHLFTMVLSSTADFGESDTLKIYNFDKSDNGRWKGIFGTDLKNSWNKVPSGQHYLYIRFICTEATTITPERWAVSECYESTADKLVVPGQVITVAKNSTVVYRFAYPQWVGGDMTIEFALNKNCFVYIADTCKMNINKGEEEVDYWLKYKALTKSSAPLVITADEIASWKDKIDVEGNFYALFSTSENSTNRKLTFTSTAPEDKDPEYPRVTIAVECDEDKNVFVHVSEDQPIVVTDVTDTKVDEWEAVVGEKHALNLQPGTYTISGKNDKIVVNL